MTPEKPGRRLLDRTPRMTNTHPTTRRQLMSNYEKEALAALDNAWAADDERTRELWLAEANVRATLAAGNR